MRGIKVLWTIVLMLLVLSIGVMNVDALHETLLTIEPDQMSGNIGETFTVDIIVHNVADLFAWQVNLTWNSNFVNVTADYDSFFEVWIPRVTYGDFLVDQPEGTNQVKSMDWTASQFLIGESTVGSHAGVDGSGWLASVAFEVFGNGDTTIDISSNDANHVGEVDATTYLLDSSASDQIAVTVEDGYFVYVSSPVDWDINEDGVIDIRDIAMVCIKWGWTDGGGSIPEDVDEDGDVDITDLSMVASNYGKYYP